VSTTTSDPVLFEMTADERVERVRLRLEKAVEKADERVEKAQEKADTARRELAELDEAIDAVRRER
jgi:hypothetical protein